MIKRCRVKLNNDAVTVVSYDDMDIQFPAIHTNASSVNVLNDGGRYAIVPDNYSGNAVLPEKSKKRVKKTTVQECAENADGTSV